jgi:MFS family permease
MLILLRSIATGGGEAFFGPANYSLLAKYHKETRSFAMSVHQTAFYLGIIVSGSLAGYIGEQFGWRYAFYIFGIAGVIHGLLMIFRLEDKDRHKEDRNKLRFLEVTKILFHTPTALIITIALCGQIFVLTGYLTWIPTYLYENFNMSLSQAGFHSLFYTHIFAFFGIIIAGMYSDKLALKDPAKRLLIQGAGLLVAAPFIILMGNSNVLITIYIGFAGFGFFRGCYDANIWACLYDVIPQKYYSSASGIILMFGFSVGSLAPLILGYLKPSLGLSLGISLLSIVWFVCGLLLLVAYKYYFRKDYMRIHQKFKKIKEEI